MEIDEHHSPRSDKGARDSSEERETKKKSRIIDSDSDEGGGGDKGKASLKIPL